MNNIVLFEPEIPQNTGNIMRTCVATDTKLHLIKPLGFVIDDAHLKRSGVNYIDKLEYYVYENWDDFKSKNPEENNMFFATTKAQHCYTDVDYSKFKDEEIFVLFGKETKGLPEDLLQKYIEKTIRIPMRPVLRSLNLSNSVCVITYEILRQVGFEGLEGGSEYFKN